MIVYKHTRLDNGIIFYIGVGSKIKRAHSTISRNEYWWNIVNSVGYTVDIIAEFETRDEANALERELILKYGRKKIDKDGILVNMTIGGDGGDTISNHPNKDKIGKATSVRLKGVKRTLEDRAKMSEGLKKYKQTLSEEDKRVLSAKQMKTLMKRRAEFGLTDKEIKHMEESTKRLIIGNKSEKRRAENSARMKIQQTGKIFTEEHRKNIGKSSEGRVHKNRRAVIINDIEYAAQGIASDELNIPISTLINRIKSINFPNYKYKE